MPEEISSDEFKMLLLTSEGNPEYQSWEGFTKLCQGAINMNARNGYTKEFEDEYIALLKAGETEKLSQALWSHQLDNYIFSSLAAFRLQIPSNVPLVPWAAENKRLYPGWHGECVNLRFLLVAGFDVDAQDPHSGNTALHHMCGLQWGPGVHLKAIRYLLDSGADCNIKNNIGDTAVTYLAGSYPWTDNAHNAFGMLMEGGGNPFVPSNDGMTALDLLKGNQADQDKSESRASLIDYLELMESTPKAKPSRKASRL
jgi:ankyrin repeat protein